MSVPQEQIQQLLSMQNLAANSSANNGNPMTIYNQPQQTGQYNSPTAMPQVNQAGQTTTFTGYNLLPPSQFQNVSNAYPQLPLPPMLGQGGQTGSVVNDILSRFRSGDFGIGGPGAGGGGSGVGGGGGGGTTPPGPGPGTGSGGGVAGGGSASNLMYTPGGPGRFNNNLTNTWSPALGNASGQGGYGGAAGGTGGPATGGGFNFNLSGLTSWLGSLGDMLTAAQGDGSIRSALVTIGNMRFPGAGSLIEAIISRGGSFDPDSVYQLAVERQNVPLPEMGMRGINDIPTDIRSPIGFAVDGTPIYGDGPQPDGGWQGNGAYASPATVSAIQGMLDQILSQRNLADMGFQTHRSGVNRNTALTGDAAAAWVGGMAQQQWKNQLANELRQLVSSRER